MPELVNGIEIPLATDFLLPTAAEGQPSQFRALAESIADVLNTGWRPIGHGDQSGEFSIPIEPGKYRMVRVVLRGSLSVGPAYLRVRVNGDDGATLYRRAWTVWRHSDASVIQNDSNNGSAWPIAYWGTATNNICTVTFYRVGPTSSFIAIESVAYRAASGESTRHRTVATCPRPVRDAAAGIVGLRVLVGRTRRHRVVGRRVHRPVAERSASGSVGDGSTPRVGGQSMSGCKAELRRCGTRWRVRVAAQGVATAKVGTLGDAKRAGEALAQTALVWTRHSADHWTGDPPDAEQRAFIEARYGDDGELA